MRAGVSPAHCAIETGREVPGIFRPDARSHQSTAELALPLRSCAGHPLRPHHRFTVSRLNRSTEHSQAVVFLQQSKFSKILGNFRGVPGDREPGVPFTWKIFKIWNAEYTATTVLRRHRKPPVVPGLPGRGWSSVLVNYTITASQRAQELPRSAVLPCHEPQTVICLVTNRANRRQLAPWTMREQMQASVHLWP